MVAIMGRELSLLADLGQCPKIFLYAAAVQRLPREPWLRFFFPVRLTPTPRHAFARSRWR